MLISRKKCVSVLFGALYPTTSKLIYKKYNHSFVWPITLLYPTYAWESKHKKLCRIFEMFEKFGLNLSTNKSDGVTRWRPDLDSNIQHYCCNTSVPHSIHRSYVCFKGGGGGVWISLSPPFNMAKCIKYLIKIDKKKKKFKILTKTILNTLTKY